jgi:hypothetical protein
MTLREWAARYGPDYCYEPAGFGAPGTVVLTCPSNCGPEWEDAVRLADYRYRSSNGGCLLVLVPRCEP